MVNQQHYILPGRGNIEARQRSARAFHHAIRRRFSLRRHRNALTVDVSAGRFCASEANLRASAGAVNL